MNVADTKKWLLVAGRAYVRAMEAKSCSLATTNLRLGQQAEQRAREGLREHLPRKLEPRFYSSVQRELSKLDAQLPNAEMNAHLHRLERCGITQMQHEQRTAKERQAVDDNRARDRHDRKRPKVRK
jgi:hypothetical protein